MPLHDRLAIYDRDCSDRRALPLSGSRSRVAGKHHKRQCSFRVRLTLGCVTLGCEHRQAAKVVVIGLADHA